LQSKKQAKHHIDYYQIMIKKREPSRDMIKFGDDEDLSVCGLGFDASGGTTSRGITPVICRDIRIAVLGPDWRTALRLVSTMSNVLEVEDWTKPWVGSAPV
jgi:hypothetical protein